MTLYTIAWSERGKNDFNRISTWLFSASASPLAHSAPICFPLCCSFWLDRARSIITEKSIQCSSSSFVKTIDHQHQFVIRNKRTTTTTTRRKIGSACRSFEISPIRSNMFSGLRHQTNLTWSSWMASAAKGLISHPTFSRSVESHGSGHSADVNYNAWRNEAALPNEDIGTQTDYNLGGTTSSNVSNTTTAAAGGRVLLGELKRRREDAIVDISLESMKYNGGKKTNRWQWQKATTYSKQNAEKKANVVWFPISRERVYSPVIEDDAATNWIPLAISWVKRSFSLSVFLQFFSSLLIDWAFHRSNAELKQQKIKKPRDKMDNWSEFFLGVFPLSSWAILAFSPLPLSLSLSYFSHSSSSSFSPSLFSLRVCVDFSGNNSFSSHLL